MKHALSISLLAAASATSALAEVRLSKLFSDHMVLQRDKPCPIWGWSDENEEVTVEFAGQSVKAKGNAKGEWKVTLTPLATNSQAQTLTAKGRNTVTVSDVLVGEVWLCSGQSNMEWTTGNSIDGDLEALTAKAYPNLRLLSVKTPSAQEPVKEPNQEWKTCTAESISAFTGVGFFFGRQLQTTLDVPVGLINNSWGGSACEAWIRRDVLEKDGEYAELLERWKKTEAEYDAEKAKAGYAENLKKWEQTAADAKAAGRPAPNKPNPPQNPLAGPQRPANLWHGRTMPILGVALRGAIWYQGESNADRAYQYRDLFPLMIQHWRQEWNQGDFPFYWVQLADFKAETPQPGESAWAELREAQSLSVSKVPHTGQAVIIDVGEANDIHPRHKLEVGRRLARLALANDYGLPIAAQSPTFASAEKKDGKIIVTLKDCGKEGLKPLDVTEVKGFAIAGEDKQWKWAQAKVIAPDKVEVSAAEVAAPVAIRYAWGDNPVCNLYTRAGLPVTPFRSDDWEGITKGKK